MAYRSLVLAASLLAMPAAAEVVQFQGHAVEVDGASDARRVVAMRSGRFAMPSPCPGPPAISAAPNVG